MAALRSSMVRSLATALIAGRTTSIALAEAVSERVGPHRVAGGTVHISIGERAAPTMVHVVGAACAAGNAPSLLAGLPVSIKDLLDVAG